MSPAHRMSRERWMALLFAIGSTCFLVGPFPGYAQLVGAAATGVTFFVGSIFFTGGGLLQSSLAFPARREPGGRADWWAAVIQSAGTLFFNVTTFQGMDTALSNPDYNRLVWRPDALGSICFLVSGAIAYRASRRIGWRPVKEGRGWWIPAVNLLGCIFFGISAVAGYVVPATGSELDLAAANWNTSLGAACFLACALSVFAAGPDQTASEAATSRGRGEGSLIAKVIGFRLDAAERARATARALRAYSSEDDLVTRLGGGLPPGGAFAALLVADAWAAAVDEAARGCDGSPLLDEVVPESSLAALGPRLVAASDAV